MKKIILVCIVMATLVSCASKKSVIGVDKNATKETQQLHGQLTTLLEKGIMFGHQDDLAYGSHWFNEQDRSDVKDVTNDYPAVIGWEIGLVETGAAYNLDSVSFVNMKRYIREAHKRGSINTISWHGNNIVTGNTSWDCKQNTVVKSVLPGAENHEKFLAWLDIVSEFLLDLKDENGVLIPVMLRLYHENTGSWFWWGNDQCTPEEYKQMWRMTVERLRDTNGVHNVIYAYSPSELKDEAHFLERYPGDGLVDVIGFDSYVFGKDMAAIEVYKERVVRSLQVVTAYATKSNKIPCFAETGMESIWYTNYFTEILYPLIADTKISYVMVWRNAWEKDKPQHHYVPFKGHPASDDFIKFVNKPKILMLQDVKALTTK